jgi:hypothetical protein
VTIVTDPVKAAEIVAPLFDAFSTTGILGLVAMPEDKPPSGVTPGSLEHILFLTLTVTIDYQRDAHQLWDSARRTYEDPETRYLFSPWALVGVPFEKVIADLQRYRLSKKVRNDAFSWRTVALTFAKKWDGDPRNFITDCGWDAPTVLDRLREDRHPQGDRLVIDYPFLRGNKIGPLWIRMLRDNAGIDRLRNLDRVPIPVDIHVARASLALGVIRGDYHGPLTGIFPAIREVWAKGTAGCTHRGRPMIALDVDEPLWHLSRAGCTSRDIATGECPHRSKCEARAFCVPGVVDVSSGRLVRLETEL